MIKLLVLTISAFAWSINNMDVSTAGFDKLSESQKADIIKQIEAVSVASKNQAVTAQVDQWVTVGERIGKAFVGCAKELNIAVNDFIHTPAGKVTLVMIVWKVMMTDIIHVGGGIIILVVSFFGIRALARMFKVESIKYDPEKVDLFKRSRKVSSTFRELGDGQIGVLVMLAVASIGCFAMCIFTL